MEHMSFWAEFSDSWTAQVMYDAAKWTLIVVAGTAFGSWFCITLLENIPGFAKEMKRWLKLNGNGLA